MSKANFLSAPLTALLAALAASSGNAAPLYFGGSGTWTGSSWSSVDGGPFTSAWVSGSDAIFNVANSTITGATTSFASITANENVTVTATGTIGTGGTVAPVFVASGKLLNFAGQAMSTAAGTGYIKNGDGTWYLAGGTYTGGFTLNAGTVGIGGVNALGAGGSLTINGGSLQSNSATARDLTGKLTAITVNGDFGFGGTGQLTFNAPVALGASTRTINNTNTATLGTTLAGNITGGAGAGLTFTGTGRTILTGTNTLSAPITLKGGILTVAPTATDGATKVVLNPDGNTVTPTFNANATAIFAANFEIGGNMIMGINSGTSTAPMVHDGNTTLLGTAATHTLTINRDLIERGTVGDGGNGNAILKTGTNQLRITGNNTFSGGFIFQGPGGTGINPNVYVGSNTALGTGKITFDTGAGRFASDSANPVTMANAVDFNANVTLGYFSATNAASVGATVGSYSQTVVPAGTPTGKLTFTGASGPIRLTGPTGTTRTLTVEADAEIGGITEATLGLALTKQGAALLTLSGANGYTGLTTVAAGEVSLTGSLASAVQVNTGAKLSGTGNVAGALTVTGGIISPGLGSGIGTLTTSSVSLDAAASLNLTINDETAGNYDRIVNGSTFSPNGSTLVVTFNDTTFTMATSAADLPLATRYPIITGPVDGTMFGNATAMSAGDVALLGLSGTQYEATFSGQRFLVEKGSVSLVPLSSTLIPEPSGVMALLAVGLGFASRRRR